MKLLTVVGARPQFIKAAAVSRALRRAPGFEEVLVHTGQHYDDDMSDAFFRELELERPVANLGVGSAGHAQQTAAMLVGLEEQLHSHGPDAVLLYGDTNSTLAGALAATKLHVPVAHVEAGLRSFNRRMAEETNRVLTDRIARWLFVPSEVARENLVAEGLVDGVAVVGDVMHDVLIWNLARAPAAPGVMARLGVESERFALATVHRAETTDDPARLRSVVRALERVHAGGLEVVLPLHPRTRARCQTLGIELRGINVVPPVSHGEILALQQNAAVVLTDSGGMQKEAYWLGVPCVTMRDETEWVETVRAGWNQIVGTDEERIVAAALSPAAPAERPPLYGEGDAAQRIVDHLRVHA